MPRVNLFRSLENEQNLARRIAYERERSGQSYAGLAKRMEDAGYPMQSSAIFKIEKGDPPRRITVDELVGFSAVFGIPVSELLLDPQVVADKATKEAIDQLNEARIAFELAQANLSQIEERVERELSRLGISVKDDRVGIAADGHAFAITGVSGRPKLPGSAPKQPSKRTRRKAT